MVWTGPKHGMTNSDKKGVDRQNWFIVIGHSSPWDNGNDKIGRPMQNAPVAPSTLWFFSSFSHYFWWLLCEEKEGLRYDFEVWEVVFLCEVSVFAGKKGGKNSLINLSSSPHFPSPHLNIRFIAIKCEDDLLAEWNLFK